MKQMIFLVAVATSLLFASCRKHTLVGDGPIVTETRTLGSFDEVQAEGDLEVTVYHSDVNKVVLTGYNSLIPVFETDISGGKLKLRFDSKYYNVRHNNLKVEVYSKDMNKYTLSGSGSANIGSGFTSSRMDLNISGSGDINIDDNYFPDMYCQISGSGNINGRYCATDNCRVRISGSGGVELSVLKSLTVDISGSGDVNYWGHPEVVTTNISGSGKVNKKG
jgi:hypothetical protein